MAKAFAIGWRGQAEAQIEHEELLRLDEQQGVVASSRPHCRPRTAPSIPIPWEVVGLAAFAGAALGAGAVAGVRYIQRVPKHA